MPWIVTLLGIAVSVALVLQAPKASTVLSRAGLALTGPGGLTLVFTASINGVGRDGFYELGMVAFGMLVFGVALDLADVIVRVVRKLRSA